MINNKLKKLIEPYLLTYLREEDWKYMEDMFTETYLTYEEGISKITLKPFPGAKGIAMQFSSINGAFVGIAPDWNYIKKIGKLI